MKLFGRFELQPQTRCNDGNRLSKMMARSTGSVLACRVWHRDHVVMHSRLENVPCDSLTHRAHSHVSSTAQPRKRAVIVLQLSATSTSVLIVIQSCLTRARRRTKPSRKWRSRNNKNKNKKNIRKVRHTQYTTNLPVRWRCQWRRSS
jgi:hypothetical protein